MNLVAACAQPQGQQADQMQSPTYSDKLRKTNLLAAAVEGDATFIALTPRRGLGRGHNLLNFALMRRYDGEIVMDNAETELAVLKKGVGGEGARCGSWRGRRACGLVVVESTGVLNVVQRLSVGRKSYKGVSRVVYR